MVHENQTTCKWRQQDVIALSHQCPGLYTCQSNILKVHVIRISVFYTTLKIMNNVDFSQDLNKPTSFIIAYTTLFPNMNTPITMMTTEKVVAKAFLAVESHGESRLSFARHMPGGIEKEYA